MEHVTDHCPQIEYLVIMTMSIVLHFAGTTCLLLNAHYPDVMNMTVPGFIWMIRGSIAPLAFSFKIWCLGICIIILAAATMRMRGMNNAPACTNMLPLT